VAVLYDTLLDWPWYRRHLEERHPWLRLPARQVPFSRRIVALIDGNLNERPVFLTEMTPVLDARYEVTGVGPLFRVTRVRPTGGASSDTRGTRPPRSGGRSRPASPSR
jgi:hypothetical protein